MISAIAQNVITLNAITLRDEAISKLQSKTAQIGVIGLGYVGLPLGLLFTEEGFRDTGFDIDTTKVDLLTSSHSYICRIPETEIVFDHSEYDYAKLVSEAQYVVDTRNATAGIHSASAVRS